MERYRQPLPREFYLRDANTMAAALLGKTLVHRTEEGLTAGIIVETEAYIGSRDKGSHAYPNRLTERTKIQFGPGGYAYIYLIYGMYSCFNVVVNREQEPDVVLIRALEPTQGLDLMAKRRNTHTLTELCSGPGKLCRAMEITRELYGCDLCGQELFLTEGREVPREEIMVSPRINIDYAEECREYLWRYFLRENPSVSRVPRRYRQAERPF